MLGATVTVTSVSKTNGTEQARTFVNCLMEPSGSVLQQSYPEFVLSKQKYRQAEGITLVRRKREEQKQSLAFSSRPFVLCGLPVRQLPKGQLLFERRNGRFLLQITGHPQYGLPFGQDRLVPIYLATLAVQQKSPTVRFRSGAEMLETFGLQKGGKEYRRFVAAFERIFGVFTSCAKPGSGITAGPTNFGWSIFARGAGNGRVSGPGVGA